MDMQQKQTGNVNFIHKIKSYVCVQQKENGNFIHKIKSYGCKCSRSKLVPSFIKSNHMHVYVVVVNW